MAVLEVVQEAIKRGRLLEPKATIVVGVSGGVDSLCLLYVLNRLRAEYQWSIHVAHLNHCLRGTEADKDMLFVARLAMDWRLPCIIKVADVKALARERRLSIEETARQARYGFLADVAHRVGASAVTVGHNADDQTETVLMHLLRGTGLAGLKGMLPSVDLKSLRVVHDHPVPPSSNFTIRLVRPLLSVPRADIERYCQTHNLSPRFDHSNLDTTFFRNRLRHELLPLLETYNPNIRALLRRTALVVAAEQELLTAALDDAWKQVVRQESEDIISIDLPSWRGLPLALQRATLRRAVFHLRPQLRDLDFGHIQQAINVATHGSTGAKAILPKGLQMTIGYNDLCLGTDGESSSVPDWPLLWRDDPVTVAMSGETQLPARATEKSAGNFSKWYLETSLWNAKGNSVLKNPDRWTAYLDVDKLETRLVLRRRKPGDRFQPLGMGGQNVEVADFMINSKIPRRWREHIPLLVHYRPGSAEKEKIAWVAGWRIDDRVKITASTRRTVRLRWLGVR